MSTQEDEETRLISRPTSMKYNNTTCEVMPLKIQLNGQGDVWIQTWVSAIRFWNILTFRGNSSVSRNDLVNMTGRG